MAAKNIVFCMEAYYILFDFVILYCIKIFSWLFFVFNLRRVCQAAVTTEVTGGCHPFPKLVMLGESWNYRDVYGHSF